MLKDSSTIIDSLVFDSDRGGGGRVFQHPNKPSIYLVAYTGEDQDGYVKSFESGGIAGDGYKGLSKIHPRMIKHVPHTESGEPIHYYHHHEKVGIWPLPDDTYMIKVFYSRVTEDITNIICGMRWLAVPYVLAMARLEEGWEDDFEMFIRIYLNNLIAYRVNLWPRINEVDSKDMFSIPSQPMKQVANG